MGRQAVLGLILDHLDVPLKIDSVMDRMTLQKVIYLVQDQGVALGYSYGWYLKGPYSPTLTRDYYSLVSSGDGESGAIELKDSVKNALKGVKSLIESCPQALPLPKWLELLASILYLKKESGFNEEGTRAKITETKPHLVEWLDDGFEALQK